MPVFIDGRVYVAAGGDLWWGKRKSWVKCFDASGLGNLTNGAEIWSYEMPTHCIATPAVHGGLVYITDAARNIHCIDAKTGKNVWTQKTGNEFWASVTVADGKLYAGNRKGEMWIMQAGRELKVLSKIEMGSAIAGTVSPANGQLFIATMEKLFCVGK
jgi:outer membrane protein assembly factor BamB